MKKLLLIPFLLLALNIFSSTKEEAIVSKITDGDTIRVFINGREEKVRLLGIDCPESKKNNRAYKQVVLSDGKQNIDEIVKAGKEATRFMKSMLQPGTKVYLEMDEAAGDRDKYKRLLRYVWKDNVLINLEMIKSGNAEPFFYGQELKYKEEITKEFAIQGTNKILKENKEKMESK